MPSGTDIYIGTSGWSYPKGEGTWKGYFYPSGKINELEYYSRFFNTVEINSSFYRPPNPGYVYNWARRVPGGFLFSVKLWQKFTHPKMYKEAYGEEAVISQQDVDDFSRSLEPLVKTGKLGVLLAQFPPSFKNDDYGRQILGALAGTFGEYPLAVELRHRSWSDDATTAKFLREHNIAWVQIDEPKFQSSVAADIPLTADTAYFRFHGRNAKEWWTGDSETRYRYLYSPEEIAGLADKVKEAGEKVKTLFAFFNNHWQAYAPRNANDLKKALQLPFQEIPVNLENIMGMDDTESEESAGKRRTV
ncbi:MAG: DUF72 domain-containing protein [Dehalococcoidales bacterium]|nr:DUF72 domain-containing protein [Dehalococcoidales bacterium]